MSQIPFSVSARTALLIGQQNFTNAEGAIIELVKNAYDADSEYCLVVFDVPFNGIPPILTTEMVSTYQLESLVSEGYYIAKNGQYQLLEEIDEPSVSIIRQTLNIHNRISIIDTGAGMNTDVITNQWMMIGTGNKDRKYLSDDGRVQTGAKGIGRFALDRLGSLTKLWTKPKDETEPGTYWEMDWKQFEGPDLSLADIKATVIDAEPLDLEQVVRDVFVLFPFLKKIPSGTFKHGTFIEISNLRDEWTLKEIENTFKGLEALIPPKELLIPFHVFQGYCQAPKLFGEVDTAFFNDYDYKMVAKFHAESLTVDFELTRNEIDLATAGKKYKSVFENAQYPYDLKTLKKKTFTFSRSIQQVIKWKKSEKNVERLSAVGDFDFTFYFLKLTGGKKDEYPYREITSSERQNTLKRFGGIKIYRDSFRVRPYGDPDNDWLDLGRRVGRSPAGVGQRIGDWRVGANQVAGIITISRVGNEQLSDKSDRGSLVENDAFMMFKRILTGMINQFEIDRSTLYNPVYLFNEAEKKKAEEARIHAEATVLAEKIYQQRLADEQKAAEDKPTEQTQPTSGSAEDEEKEQYRQMAEETIRQFIRPEDKDAEIAQVRNLASLGLIMASFAHELRNVQYNTSEIDDLEDIYEQIASEAAKHTKPYRNGKSIFKLLKSDNAKVKHWVDYSLTSIKKDKRQRKELSFNDYFATLKNDWQFALADRFISMTIDTAEGNYSFRAFEMDMNTIFSNLITNSIDSFNSAEELIDRVIDIRHQVTAENIEITYHDNGPGLPDVFVDKEEVFLPFTTSKKDKDGQDIGTGLGMYLVKNVVQEYNGTVEILDTEEGFSLKIDFPTRKNNADV
jgi:signal transduction histidine kinase